jgi:hypothetical protein
MLVQNRVVCGLGLVLALGLVGCSENSSKKPKIRRIEGVAKTIDLEKNQVSMVVRNDKGIESELMGTIREDTEVWINGRSQQLQDIRPGDNVVVFGYREGSGEAKKLVATKVEVTRPRDSDWKSTAKPIAKEPAVAAQKPEPKPVTKAPAKPAATTPPAGQTGQPRAAPPTTIVDEQQAMDLLYATMRIRMEEAIEERATLLKAGTEPSDPQVRRLEGVIMRARDLLTDAGEVVEPVEPPIVELAGEQDDQDQQAPPEKVEPKKEPAPAAQPPAPVPGD